MPNSRALRLIAILVVAYGLGLVGWVATTSAQPRSPADVFGFEPGDDYKLASYEQMEAYYGQLAAESDRVQLRTIGETVEGHEMYLLIISSPENLARLDDLKATSRTLARARLGEEEARRLADQGKAVVWVDAGLHATEMAHGQMAPLLAHRLATEESAEMRHIRENVVTLLMPMMNPDGLEIVRKWYEQQLGTPYEATNPPELYHHYVGHDNNRDWFMMNMPESRAVSDVVYNDWHPQIVLNHHQISPPYARIVIPPYSDPVNPKIHPGVTTALNEVGNAMARRYALSNMPGAIADVGFDMWWNGGMRTTPYYHNMVGILTEVGHNWPSPMLFDPDKFPLMRAYRSLRGPIETLEGIEEMSGTRVDYPYPWPGGESHFRAPIDYMITGTLAVLKLAADKPDEYLHNIYRMGRAAIARGESSETRTYVIPAGQRNFAEAHHLVNTLFWGGIEIARAEADFELGGKRYAAGSFIIDTAQAFRPHLLDMLERQDYPALSQYPGGPPDDPYDITGWTLPMQMDVAVDRAAEPVSVEARPIEAPIAIPAGRVVGESAEHYALDSGSNASIKAVNDLLRAGARIERVADGFTAEGESYTRGSFVVSAEGLDRATLSEVAGVRGVDFVALDSLSDVPRKALSLPRVGIYQSYVASEDEGWTRWVFERYGFDTVTLNDADLRAADGLEGIDAVVIPEQEGTPPGEGIIATLLHGYPHGMMPPAYSQGIGLEGAFALKAFVEGGGRLLTFGSASRFAIETLGLPVRDVAADYATSDFFIPGTLLAAKGSADDSATAGLPRDLVVNFVRGGAYALKNYEELQALGRGKVLRRAEAPSAPVDFVMRYGEAEGLVKSGWARGEELIAGKGAMVRIGLGDGAVLLYGFRPQFRGQSRGTYKLVFNPIYEAAAN